MIHNSRDAPGGCPRPRLSTRLLSETRTSTRSVPTAGLFYAGSGGNIDNDCLGMFVFFRYWFTLINKCLNMEANSIFSYSDSLFQTFALCHTLWQSGYGDCIAAL